jgi:hypothetical protein
MSPRRHSRRARLDVAGPHRTELVALLAAGIVRVASNVLRLTSQRASVGSPHAAEGDEQ